MNNDSIIFFKLVRDFLEKYLPSQKGASKHTIRSYRNTLNQFLDFSTKDLDIKLSEFKFTLTSTNLIEKFLIYGEKKLKWSICTRNQKLAAIKSFYKYCSRHDCSLIVYYEEIKNIPIKREIKSHEIDFFSEEVLKVLLKQPDPNSKKEYRNLVLMILMYDVAGRIQEILDIRLKDLHLKDKSPYLVLHGKGSKVRLVPLMDKTVEHLNQYLSLFHKDNKNDMDYLFYTIHEGFHTQMSQDCVQKFIDKYCQMARKTDINVPEHIYCHMFRHSRAMHLYRNGMPLPLVSEWLGHAQINTTRQYYANADVEMKRKAINKATSSINPLLTEIEDYNLEDDELIKKLYGLK